MVTGCEGAGGLAPPAMEERAVTEVIVFHHVLGVTDGVRHFAERLRGAGHEVSVPDLFEGQVFASRDEGLAYVQTVGLDGIIERGRTAAESVPAAAVYLGFSMGVLPAQVLAQTRPGTKGAVFCYGFLPPSEFGSGWPPGVPLQIHVMEDDKRFKDDLEVTHEFVGSCAAASLFLYEGDGHLFADRSSHDYDEAAAEMMTSRVITFLNTV